MRGERFIDGHWEAMIEQGHIRRLLERLRELRGGVDEGQWDQEDASLTTGPQ